MKHLVEDEPVEDATAQVLVEDEPTAEDLALVLPLIEDGMKKELSKMVRFRNQMMRAAGMSKMKLDQLRRLERKGDPAKVDAWFEREASKMKGAAGARAPVNVEDDDTLDLDGRHPPALEVKPVEDDA